MRIISISGSGLVRSLLETTTKIMMSMVRKSDNNINSNEKDKKIKKKKERIRDDEYDEDD